MTDADGKTPPFKQGDIVTIVSPTPDRGRHGTVVEVFRSSGDRIYRYRIRFNDGTVSKFFGFELESCNSKSIPPGRAS
jgi:hypothetical protein